MIIVRFIKHLKTHQIIFFKNSNFQPRLHFNKKEITISIHFFIITIKITECYSKVQTICDSFWIPHPTPPHPKKTKIPKWFNQGVYTQYTHIKSKLISLISAQSQGGTRWDQYHWMWMLVDPSFHIGDSVWICALHMGQVFSRSNHMETQFSQNMCWKEKKRNELKHFFTICVYL